MSLNIATTNPHYQEIFGLLAGSRTAAELDANVTRLSLAAQRTLASARQVAGIDTMEVVRRTAGRFERESISREEALIACVGAGRAQTLGSRDFGGGLRTQREVEAKLAPLRLGDVFAHVCQAARAHDPGLLRLSAKTDITARQNNELLVRAYRHLARDGVLDQVLSRDANDWRRLSMGSGAQANDATEERSDELALITIKGWELGALVDPRAPFTGTAAAKQVAATTHAAVIASPEVARGVTASARELAPKLQEAMRGGLAAVQREHAVRCERVPVAPAVDTRLDYLRRFWAARLPFHQNDPAKTKLFTGLLTQLRSLATLGLTSKAYDAVTDVRSGAPTGDVSVQRERVLATLRGLSSDVKEQKDPGGFWHVNSTGRGEPITGRLYVSFRPERLADGVDAFAEAVRATGHERDIRFKVVDPSPQARHESLVIYIDAALPPGEQDRLLEELGRRCPDGVIDGDCKLPSRPLRPGVHWAPEMNAVSAYVAYTEDPSVFGSQAVSYNAAVSGLYVLAAAVASSETPGGVDLARDEARIGTHFETLFELIGLGESFKRRGE